MEAIFQVVPLKSGPIRPRDYLSLEPQSQPQPPISFTSKILKTLTTIAKLNDTLGNANASER